MDECKTWRCYCREAQQEGLKIKSEYIFPYLNSHMDEQTRHDTVHKLTCLINKQVKRIKVSDLGELKHHVTTEVVTNGSSDNETTPKVKALNMINHLKHATGSDSTDASQVKWQA